MIDNKIIEAIDCCRIENCYECPYREYFNCREVLAQDTIDLINRQKAEINELENKCDDCAGCTQWKCDCANIKAEAIKEFVEKFKKRECSNAFCCWCVHADSYGHRAKECDEPYIDKNGKEQKACYAYAKFESYIDNLVREMTKEE